ncbi:MULTISPECIES: hypothetical protein [unclassified Streptomyces]|uniref:hypothetical protein n=1 Tax=unclassified Streptomyces TaxID=2593676 RepID=UPI0036E1B9D9
MPSLGARATLGGEAWVGALEAAVSKKSCKPKGSCMGCTPCGRRPCTAWQGPRSLARLGRTVVTYRSCLRLTVAAWASVVALLVAATASGLLLPLGTAAGLVTLAWMATALRVLRLAPTSPGPGGGPGPGGAGVREPRRPGPHPPADAIGLLLPEDLQGGTAAWS